MQNAGMEGDGAQAKESPQPSSEPHDCVFEARVKAIKDGGMLAEYL